jgi:hypothetical protein
LRGLNIAIDRERNFYGVLAHPLWAENEQGLSLGYGKKWETCFARYAAAGSLTDDQSGARRNKTPQAAYWSFAVIRRPILGLRQFSRAWVSEVSV